MSANHTFESCFAVLVGHEGGFTKHSGDRGNWTSGVIGKGELRGTKYGISAMAYPDLDIWSLTLDDARGIYRLDYWDKLRLDGYPPALRYSIFDAAVNHGVTAAAKLVQRTVGVPEDGHIGPKTMAAVEKLAASPQHFALLFNAYRLELFASIASFNEFGRGWTRRVAAQMKDSARAF